MAKRSSDGRPSDERSSGGSRGGSSFGGWRVGSSSRVSSPSKSSTPSRSSPSVSRSFGGASTPKASSPKAPSSPKYWPTPYKAPTRSEVTSAAKGGMTPMKTPTSAPKKESGGFWNGVKNFFSWNGSSWVPQNASNYGQGTVMGIGYYPTWIRDSKGNMTYSTSAAPLNSPETTPPYRRDSNWGVKTTPAQRQYWNKANGLGNWTTKPVNHNVDFWGGAWKNNIVNNGWVSWATAQLWARTNVINHTLGNNTASSAGSTRKYSSTGARNSWVNSKFYIWATHRTPSDPLGLRPWEKTPQTPQWRKQFTQLEISNFFTRISKEKDPYKQRRLIETYKKAFWDKGYDISWFDKFPIWAKMTSQDKANSRMRNQNPVGKNESQIKGDTSNRKNTTINKNENSLLTFINNLKNKGKQDGSKEKGWKLLKAGMAGLGALGTALTGNPLAMVLWASPSLVGKLGSAANRKDIANNGNNQNITPTATNNNTTGNGNNGTPTTPTNTNNGEGSRFNTRKNTSPKRETAVDTPTTIAEEAYDYALNNSKVQEYTAENGKTYKVFSTPDGRFAFKSKVDWSVKAFDKIGDMLNAINKNNSMSEVDKTSVENKDAVKGGEIKGTYTAPSGKQYEIMAGTGANKDKIGFVGINGQIKWFDSWGAAKNNIDVNNPIWNTDIAKNTPLPELANESYIGEDGLPKTEVEEIDDANKFNKEENEEVNERIEDFMERTEKEIEYLKEQGDDVYNKKLDILKAQFWDIDKFWKEIDAAIDDLKKKSELVQDNERMRWAKQRAAELAAQGYLTSEQVSQVANYSIAEYTKELRDAAAQADKAIAELRVSIAQKKQEAIADIRKNQMLTENDRIAQENYISEKYDKFMQFATNKWTEGKQFYDSNINANLGANIQNKLGIKSIVQQNDAKNIVDDRNKIRAYTDSVYRQEYILSKIPDVNLHPYALKAIKYLISQDKFLQRGKSETENQRILAEQISSIASAAQKMQMDDMLKAKK